VGGVDEIAPGIWYWTARHPEWHPQGAFGAQVGSYALRLPGPARADTLLVDPLFAADGTPPAGLDDVVAAGHGLLIAITIGYHVRSTAHAWRRWGDAHAVTILGHERLARRLPAGAPLQAITPQDVLPHGLGAQAIGSPRRNEMPLYVPQHRALLVGDAIVVTPQGELRVWVQHELTDQRRRWYRERLAPSLRGLAALDVERVLVTHGPPVLSGGAAALAQAIEDEPWNRN
jgi:glyoxylase-like metal-dependent hydrolase (beta-lactamase superfamily II)